MSDLNEELLREEPAVPSSPKRNSKQALIQKIIETAEKIDVKIEESDSKLKRMNKEQLNKKLAELMETHLRKKMAEQVGINNPTGHETNRVLNIGALRMVHNIVVSGGERLYNGIVAPRIGYELTDFAKNLSHPAFQEGIDQCLVEIANESPEVLQYFESPYTRLMMIWFSCAVTSCKKIEPKTNVSAMEPDIPMPPMRRCTRRRPPNGKIVRDDAPYFGKTLRV